MFELYKYSTIIHPFNGYVDHFYEKKKEAKTPQERFLAKLNLNSIFGSTGKKHNTRVHIVVNEEFFNEINKYKHIVDYTVYRFESDEPRYIITYEKDDNLELLNPNLTKPPNRYY